MIERFIIPTLRISPLPSKNIRRIPIGFLHPDGTITAEAGAQLYYCGGISPALAMARATGGKALILRTRSSTRWLRFQVADDIEILPGIERASFEQLVAWRDYCYSVGVEAGSIQRMAFNLFRYTLPGYFDADIGDKIPFNHFPPGPRLHSKPGVWLNVRQYDITAAYLWGIGRNSPAKSYAEIGRISLHSLPEDSWALVKYRLPGTMTHGPLPMLSNGSTIFPTMGRQWSEYVVLHSRDILCGMGAGAEFRIRKAWVPGKMAPSPFSGFMHLIAELRSRTFGAIAKQAGNTLWGSFASNANTALVTFTLGGRHSVRPMPPREPLCVPIGYSVLASLRSRLYMDAIDQVLTFQAHTDGFITRSRIDPPVKEEAVIGGWRRVADFRSVEILGPTWYKQVHLDGKVTYKLAGRSDSESRAETIFAHHRERLIKDGSIEVGFEGGS